MGSDGGQRYFLEDLSLPLRFERCPELLPILAEVMPGWRIQPAPDGGEEGIGVWRSSKGYTRSSRWQPKPVTFRHPVDAVCDLIVDIIHAYVADHPGLLCLHCAALEFRDGLVLVPSTYRSGKSTLSVKLASRGARLFTDDVLPVAREDRCGVALGIRPRLRMPLPESADDDFRAFVAQRSSPTSHRYAYVDVGEDGQAPRGTRSAIRAVVVLERGAEGPAELVPADRGRMLKDVILRNFARQNAALEILDCLHSIVAAADCYTLRYDELEPASRLLIDAFGPAGQADGAVAAAASARSRA